MLKGLEYFWLGFTLICLAGATVVAIMQMYNDALLLVLCATMGGFRYILRKKQRRRMQPDQERIS